jgi:hypothetical protein
MWGEDQFTVEEYAMQTTLHIETTVLPGNRVEFSSPQLPEGAKVEVTVVLAKQATPRFELAYDFLQSLPPAEVSMVDFLKTLPPGPRAFDTWEEYERFLEEEKNSWD